MPVRIEAIDGLEVLDSRGFPTIRAVVRLTNGVIVCASAPSSGDSGGPKEAVQRRDGDSQRYGGQGVRSAVATIRDIISPRFAGTDPTLQHQCDRLLIELDGTPDKSRLGANVTLSVSMAIARAGAVVEQVPLYWHLGGASARRLPLPMMNVLNGGSHADNNVDLEEFMVVPIGAPTFSEGVRWGTETFHALGRLLRENDMLTTVGDEGGFAPLIPATDPNDRACGLIVEAMEIAGYRPGIDLGIAIDAAASQFFDGERFQLRWSGQKSKSRDDMLGLYGSLIWQYPIVALEDGLAADDWVGSRAQTSLFGWKIQTIGDDLYATDSRHIAEGARQNATNAVVIRPSQTGTVTEALEAVEACRQAGWAPIVAASPADTEDTFVADFAVAAGCGQIKAGSASRGERIAKYNRLIEIEQELGDAAAFCSPLTWKPWREAAQEPHRRR